MPKKSKVIPLNLPKSPQSKVNRANSKSQNDTIEIKKPPHRPREYNRQEVTAYVCEQIASGKSLRAALRSKKNLPTPQGFLRWLNDANDPAALALNSQYTRARALGWELLADEVLELADQPTESSVEAQRARLQFDARRWLLSKMLPKVYGDKIQQEVTGEGGGPIQLAAVDLRQLSDDELKSMETIMQKIEHKK
tara:strand:- start:131 stop:715 length:585 start_codon:yes stop_codon:yes gene_type:complete